MEISESQQNFNNLDDYYKRKVYLDYLFIALFAKIIRGDDYNRVSYEEFCQYNTHQKWSIGSNWLDKFKCRINGFIKFSDYDNLSARQIGNLEYKYSKIQE